MIFLSRRALTPAKKSRVGRSQGIKKLIRPIFLVADIVYGFLIPIKEVKKEEMKTVIQTGVS